MYLMNLAKVLNEACLGLSENSLEVSDAGRDQGGVVTIFVSKP